MQPKFFEKLSGNQGAALRLATLLLVITLSILASKLWEEYYVESLQNDCASLFSDRLIPATALYHLNDTIHQDRGALKELLHGAQPSRELAQYSSGQRDAAIEHQVTAIEATFLVEEEKRLLRELRVALERYAALKKQLLQRHEAGERVSYGQDIQAAFDLVHTELSDLVQVQQTVGQKLKSDTLISAANLSTLLYFQLGVAFSLGIIASGLAMALRPRQPRSNAREADKLH